MNTDHHNSDFKQNHFRKTTSNYKVNLCDVLSKKCVALTIPHSRWLENEWRRRKTAEVEGMSEKSIENRLTSKTLFCLTKWCSNQSILTLRNTFSRFAFEFCVKTVWPQLNQFNDIYYECACAVIEAFVAEVRTWKSAALRSCMLHLMIIAQDCVGVSKRNGWVIKRD